MRRELRRVGDEARAALAVGSGVVALETTVLVHGLPLLDAEAMVATLDGAVRAGGAVPAFVGVLDGVAVVGLSTEEVLALVGRRDEVRKVSTRDLGLAVAAGVDGATTVAATIALAAAEGIEVMATGGIGGVHLGAHESFDESADLVALASTPCLVVASGAKSVLDVAATLERLDTLGVPVVGFATSTFPWFYLRDSGLPVDWSVDTPELAARAFVAHRGLASGGMLLANPVPAADELDPELHARVLADALHEAHEHGVVGADVTPMLLASFAAATGGASVATNVALLRSNALLGASVAAAIAADRRG